MSYGSDLVKKKTIPGSGASGQKAPDPGFGFATMVVRGGGGVIGVAFWTIL
jgi:hypothetical protein